MKFFTTPNQKKILRKCWSSKKSLDEKDLLGEGIVGERLLKWSLSRMVRKGQLIRLRNGRYLATTKSEQEFEALRKGKATAATLFSTGDPSLMGLNDYEVEEVLREMNRLIREARKEKKRKSR